MVILISHLLSSFTNRKVAGPMIDAHVLIMGDEGVPKRMGELGCW